jgi:hypothetical protein
VSAAFRPQHVGDSAAHLGLSLATAADLLSMPDDMRATNGGMSYVRDGRGQTEFRL